MTYEEIQKYPIGIIYKQIIKKRPIKGYWFNSTDKQIISNYKNISNLCFYDNYTYTGVETEIYKYKIDGWIFDGKEWHCAELTWDGYQEIDDEEILY